MNGDNRFFRPALYPLSYGSMVGPLRIERRLVGLQPTAFANAPRSLNGAPPGTLAPSMPRRRAYILGSPRSIATIRLSKMYRYGHP